MIGCRPFALMIFRHYRGLKKIIYFKSMKIFSMPFSAISPPSSFTHQLQISSAFGILQLN